MHQIIDAADAIERELQARFKVTILQFKLARLLLDEPRTIGELTQALHRAPSTLTTVLDRLERIGYVRRVRSEQDRRAITIHLVDPARARQMMAWCEHNAGEIPEVRALLQSMAA